MKIFWAIITVLTMFWGLDFSGKALKVEQVWARAAVAGAPSTTVYFTINNNTSDADSMFAASSKVAENVTIMETTVSDGIESSREMKLLPVDPNTKKVLKPHGYFLTLTGLNKALVVGDSIPITLNFTKAGLVETKAHVESPNATMFDNF